MSKSKISIFLVDDHRLVREGFHALIKDNDQLLELSGQASNGLEALQKIEQLNTLPDVVVMDIHMPVMSGLQACSELVEKYPDIKVLALTMIDQSAHVREMIKNGASGYLIKDCDYQEFITAVKKVHQGESYFSPEIAKMLDSHIKLNGKEFKNITDFTDNEQSVLRSIIADKPDENVISELGISQQELQKCKESLMQKTGTNSRAGLVVHFLKNNMH